MTIVRIRIHPDCESVTIRQLRRYWTEAVGLQLPHSFNLPLADGQASVDLAPSDLDGPGPAWVIAELGGITRAVIVPSSTDVLDYEDLAEWTVTA